MKMEIGQKYTTGIQQQSISMAMDMHFAAMQIMWQMTRNLAHN